MPPFLQLRIACRSAVGRLLQPVVGVDEPVAVGLEPDRVDARVRSSPARELEESLTHVLGGVVDDVGRARARPRHLEAVVEAVDRDHPLRSEHACARDRELADRPRAPHRDRVAALDVAHLRAHVAGREDVGEEQDLLVVEAGRDLQRPHVRERHADVLRLPARVAAEHVRVAEQPRRRVPPQRGRDGGVGVRVLAEGGLAFDARRARAARDGEGDDDPIPDAEVLHPRADLYHLPHELVPEHVALLHGGDEAVVEVQVGAADGGRRHADDRVALVQDPRIGDLDDVDLLLAEPAVRFHWGGLLVRSITPSPRRPARPGSGAAPRGSRTERCGSSRRGACSASR